jgi:hypothetical protein
MRRSIERYLLRPMATLLTMLSSRVDDVTGATADLPETEYPIAAGELVWATVESDEEPGRSVRRFGELTGEQTGDVVHLDPVARPVIVGELRPGVAEIFEEHPGGFLPMDGPAATDGTALWFYSFGSLVRADALTGHVQLVSGVFGDDVDVSDLVVIDGGVWLVGGTEVDRETVDRLWFVGHDGEVQICVDITLDGSHR